MIKTKHRGFLILLAVVGVLLTGCSLIPTRLPSWQPEYQIPLVVSQTSADELFSDSPLENDGEHYFITESVNGSFTLGLDNLNLEDFNSTATVQFPALDLGNILTTDFLITDTPLPVAPLVNGIDLPVGDISFSEFELLGIKDGALNFRAENLGNAAISFTVQLAFEQATLEIEVLDLQPGTTRSIETSLDNLTIGNTAKVTILNPQVVGIGTAELNLGISGLSISSLGSIKGYDADLNITVSNSLDLPEDNLEDILVQSGKLQINTLPIDALSMTVNSITLDGDHLASLGQNSFSLANKHINKGTVLEANFDIQIDGNTLFTVPEEVTIQAEVSELELQAVLLSSLTVNLEDAAEQSIAVPDITLSEPFNKVRLGGASLGLILGQNLGDLVYDDLYLTVKLNDNSTYSVEVAEVIDSGLDKKVLFENENVTKLINDIISGDVAAITIDGKVYSNGPVVITDQSVVDFTADIYLPFKLEANQSIDYTIDMEPQIVELDDESKQLLADYLSAVKLEAEIDNGLAIGLDFSIQLKNEQNTVIATLQGKVQPGVTDANGIVTGSSRSTVVIELDNSQVVSLLEAGEIQFTPTVKLNVPENGALIKPEDFIKLRALLLVKVQINGGELR